MEQFSCLMNTRVSCRAAVNGINGCLTDSTCHSRNYYYQYSHTTNLQSAPVDQMSLPRKLRKSILRNTYFLTQKRKFVPHCSSDLGTSCREVPNYLSINVLQDKSNTKQGAIRKVLVILNPNSGFRSSRDVFYKKVRSTLKLSGFKMEVIETAYAGHAKVISSTVDLRKFPDGIICVGGDGIVNEVLNGLLSRDDFEVAIRFPIGIIPAGSDNSLVWTVLGIRDPVSAAIALAKAILLQGGFTPIDVLAVKWIQAGVPHFGLTVSYYGLVADDSYIAVYVNWGFTSIKGIGWGWVAIVWLFYLVFYFPLDILKFLIQYAQSGKALNLVIDQRVIL